MAAKGAATRSCGGEGRAREEYRTSRWTTKTRRRPGLKGRKVMRAGQEGTHIIHYIGINVCRGETAGRGMA